MERMYAVVQGRAKMVRGGSRVELHDRETVGDIIYVAFILHNMTVARLSGGAGVPQLNEAGAVMPGDEILRELEEPWGRRLDYEQVPLLQRQKGGNSQKEHIRLRQALISQFE